MLVFFGKADSEAGFRLKILGAVPLAGKEQRSSWGCDIEVAALELKTRVPYVMPSPFRCEDEALCEDGWTHIVSLKYPRASTY